MHLSTGPESGTRACKLAAKADERLMHPAQTDWARPRSIIRSGEGHNPIGGPGCPGETISPLGTTQAPWRQPRALAHGAGRAPRMTAAIMSRTPQGQQEVSQVGQHLPWCRRVAHPWHARRVTEALRLRCKETVRGLRQHTECPQAVDVVLDAGQRVHTHAGDKKPFARRSVGWKGSCGHCRRIENCDQPPYFGPHTPRAFSRSQTEQKGMP